LLTFVLIAIAAPLVWRDIKQIPSLIPTRCRRDIPTRPIIFWGAFADAQGEVASLLQYGLPLSSP
jgi:hypothetical protein